MNTAVAAVTLNNASLRYDGVAALNDVTLSIESGQKVALVGPSGAGKTSLIHAVAGRSALTSGSTRVFQQELAQLKGRSLRALRGRIGLVAQGLDLALALRVVHNVNAAHLGNWSSAQAAWSLVRPKTAEATQVLAKVGLEDRVLARTDELSGGERQRVAIARVLLQRPDLMLADEPTSSVDPSLADQLMALLCDGPHTLVVSAHDPQLARRHVDRIIGMRAGRIVLDDVSDHVSDAQLADFYDG